jgi:hypothetical protein
MATDLYVSGTDEDYPLAVQPQQVHGRPSRDGESDDGCAVYGPDEMITPAMSARMKERADLPGQRIGPRLPIRFSSIAVEARQGQVVEIVAAVVR